MAPKSTALTIKAESGSPYQLNSAQTLKASTALLKHIKEKEVSTSKKQEKKNLLEDADDEETATPIWLNLTTKTHIVDKKRLKPTKIPLPHPLHTSSNATICLITADPQRTYKDIVASPAFPSSLSARITKVVGVKKIKAKHTQYEAQRKLKAEHDIFLADDRIITSLPKLLGKTMYKGTKRPIPIDIAAPAPTTEGKRQKRTKDSGSSTQPASAQAIAKEIEKALAATVVHLSPSINTAIKIGYSNWDAEKLAENVEAVASALIEKHVPQKWRNVRALHVKGESTAALPIWLADELWTSEADVVNDEVGERIKEANVGRKRRAVESAEKEAKRQKSLKPSSDERLDAEIAGRKERLRRQKEEAARDVVDEVPKVSKKGKKGKGVAV